MSKLPIVNFKTMDAQLRQLGLVPTRQTGSHVFYRHPDGRTTTIPNHPGRGLTRPLTREISCARSIRRPSDSETSYARFEQEATRRGRAGGG